MVELYTVANEKPLIVWAFPKLIKERINANSYNIDFIRFNQRKHKTNQLFKKISDIANVSAMIGWKGLTSEHYVKNNGMYLIRTTDIKDKFVCVDNAVMVEREKAYEQPQIILKNGDIIFSKDGTLGFAAIVQKKITEEICAGSTLARIRPILNKIDNYFLLACLLSRFVYSQISYYVTGIAQPHINQEFIKEIEIPLPPRPIQEYIGNKIRKAEELREEARQLKKEADIILNDVLLLKELQEDIKKEIKKYNWASYIDNRLDAEFYKDRYEKLNNHLTMLQAKGITIKRLEDIVYSGNYGVLPESEDYGKGHITLIRSTDLEDYLINYESCPKVPEKYLVEKAAVKRGNILLEIKGSITGGAVVINELPKAIINGSIYQFKPKQEHNNYYILSILQSVIGELQKEQHKSNSVISYLNLEVIKSLRIPVISTVLQNEIGSKLKEYAEKTNQTKKLINEAKQDVEGLIEGKFDESKITAER